MNQKIHTLAGFGPPLGSHFLAARPTLAGFSHFFKNVEFSEMVKEFGTFCEHVGCQNLSRTRIFAIFSSHEKNEPENKTLKP